MTKKLIMPGEDEWGGFWKTQKSPDRNISWSKRRIIRTITPFLSTRRRALDAGCGGGFFSEFFYDSHLDTVAVDFSKEALELTKKRTKGKVHTLRADILSPEFPELFRQPFDVIFTDGLFEHFETLEQDRIMQNFKKILTEQGIIATFVPNRFSPWELMRPFFMPGIEEKPFVLKELVNLNLRNGLKVLQKGGINVLPFRVSPDKIFGSRLGMLLYTISQKR